MVKSRSYLQVFLSGIFLCAAFYCPAHASNAPGPSDAVDSSPPSDSSPQAMIAIPGTLRSFLRMAAISQKVSPEEVLPFLARNVFVNGYKHGEATEYMTLLQRYVSEARDLARLAGPEQILRASSCKEAEALLAVLGYQLKEGGCGPKATAEAFDPDRAFVTVDSGFPLEQLEETLRTGNPFVYSLAAKVPVLFTQNDWMPEQKRAANAEQRPQDLIDVLLGDPDIARLYWGLSRMDAETRDALQQSPGLPKLMAYAPVLDFYGGHITIRSGRVAVPGGDASESAWADLVGASPASPAEFVTQLLGKDEGWLAAYFDALSRLNQSRQAYFSAPQRLRLFYLALRGQNSSPGPASGVFRLDSNLMLLVTRLQFDATGQPHVPGDLEAWKEILNRRQNAGSKVEQDWGKRAGQWKTPDQLVEGMFGLCRVAYQHGPVQLYLTLSEIDRGRPAEQRLSPQTVRLMGDNFWQFGDQYLLFSEFNALDNASIARFLTMAEGTNHIKNRVLRADTLGLLQSNVGLWQVLARQGEIAGESLSGSWQGVVSPFANIRSSVQLFDAGRSSLGALLKAAAGRSDLSQDEIIALLASPPQNGAEAQQVRQAIASRMRSVMDDQRLVSLDTLFALADGLNQKADGAGRDALLTEQAGELRAFEMPRPLFTTRERAAWASRFFYNIHADTEMKTDLTKAIQSRSPKDVAEARGKLTPFLRDTLVGLNYAYYEPPGAQLLHNNPLFVRFHDFSGGLTGDIEGPWQTPILMGRGDTPSGGAHLSGSLANLPYVLAEVEQGMFVPENIQSLIWEDLVPDLVASAILPRWWGVSRDELHAVTLYQRAGEELLTAAAGDEPLRQSVMGILADRMLPERWQRVEDSLRSGRVEDALALTTPAETFYLTAEFRKEHPAETGHWKAAGDELQDLIRRSPEEASWQRLSEDFGVPHPALAQSYSRELLDGEMFPSFMVFASQLLAESWDSTNLFWARLADEKGYQPVALNLLVPELTRRMIGKISATHPEDWPAVLRAMRETGDEFREGKISPLPQTGANSGG